MLNYLNKAYSKIKNSKNSFKIVGGNGNKILSTPYIYMFGLFIMSILVVSSAAIANDAGNNNINGILFNSVPTPHIIDANTIPHLQANNKGFNVNVNPFEIQLFSETNITPGNNSIQKAINNASENDTIILTPGDYNESNITVNKTGLTIKAETPGTVTVNANWTGRVFDVANSSVSLIGLTIKNGNATINDEESGPNGGGIVTKAENDSVINCTIINNTAFHGGGVYIGNPPPGHVENGGRVINCIIINNNAASEGGGVFIDGSIVTDCTIENNTASVQGGGVRFKDGGIVTNCNITNNNASSSGGVYVGENCIVTNCNITNNTATSEGGGVVNDGGNVTDCTIIDNTASSDGGGVVSKDGGIVTNCTITNNNATHNGGGVFTDDTGATVTDCNITNNIAGFTNDYHGGGVFGGGGTVTNCNITNNKAYYYGGGVYVSYDCKVTNCTITNNNATQGGGVLYGEFSNENSSVTNCTIIDNNATQGGGVYVYGGEGTVTYNRIIGNTGGNGYVHGDGSTIDYNWWGTNNISNANIDGNNDTINGSLPNSYFLIQLSANNNYTRTNTSMNVTNPVTLTYNMVLNTTNNSADAYKLPDFSTMINSPIYNGTVNAKESWNNISNDLGEYNFQAICDNEDLHINLLVVHPRYDLKLKNDPSGSVVIGTRVTSTATAIGGNPLSTDYVEFVITPPSKNPISKNVTFNGNSCSFGWQVNEIGSYFVQVWAYAENGDHVKVPDSQPSLRGSFSTSSKRDSSSTLNSQITYSQEVIDVE
jgi:parallel beta-helix repeat protein